MRRCVKSLIKSVNYAKRLLADFSFELKVFDDHSSEDAINNLKNNLNLAEFPIDLVSLDTRGIMPSIMACYQYGKDNGKDWVYFVQDDYLYEETAIYDMLITAITTSNAINNYTSIFPYDDPYRYAPVNTAVQSHIIRSQGRHWRTQIMTASCFMTHHTVIQKNWDLFKAMGTSPVCSTMEDTTINQLFRTRGYYLFVPIPSLALHMQFEVERDPFIDWKKLWDEYETKNNILNEITDKKILLNIGFGGEYFKDSGYTDGITDYKEITYDINSKLSPDIVGDIKDLSGIPSNYADYIFTSHTLEHIDYFDIPLVLKEFTRILKPDGKAKIIVPNIKVVGMYLVQDNIHNTLYESAGGPVTPYDIIYGHQLSIKKHNNEFMRHKAGFTPKFLTDLSNKYNLNLSFKEKGYDLVITLLKC